jgi:pimeloyl-ACP methyl ester carboxylesterase
MLVYAYRFPGEVAGLVLVDPSHPEMFERVPQIPSPQAMGRSFKVIAGIGRVGLLRWLGPALVSRLLPHGRHTLPHDAWQALLAFASRVQDYETARRETMAGLESVSQARGGAGSLGDLPLEVLSAEWWTTGKMTPMKQAAFSLRKEQAALSSRGRHTLVSGCEHSDLPVLRPDAIAEAVQRVLETHAYAIK